MICGARVHPPPIFLGKRKIHPGDRKAASSAQRGSVRTDLGALGLRAQRGLSGGEGTHRVRALGTRVSRRARRARPTGTWVQHDHRGRQCLCFCFPQTKLWNTKAENTHRTLEYSFMFVFNKQNKNLFVFQSPGRVFFGLLKTFTRLHLKSGPPVSSNLGSRSLQLARVVQLPEQRAPQCLPTRRAAKCGLVHIGLADDFSPHEHVWGLTGANTHAHV